LTDGKGHSLYAFVPATAGATTCTGSCAAVWPPFHLAKDAALDMSPLLAEARFVLQPVPEGGSIVKYWGWLLHSYTGDSSSRVAKGQGLSADGGHWYVISPSGKLITKRL
jgi:predicted lipoprotein with Yx(FWY)xxD motif